MTNNAQPRTQQSTCEMDGAGSQSPAPVSASLQGPATSTRASKSQESSLTAAAPAARTFFDPWNSSSTGHQRAENRLSCSTSWRVSRNLKLSEQYKGGLDGGGKRVADTVGAGSGDFGEDGRKANGGWETGAQGLSIGRQKSLTELWGASKAGKKSSQENAMELHLKGNALSPPSDASSVHDEDTSLDFQDDTLEALSKPLEKQIFANLCFYTNGSTAPLVSDHKLKHMLAAHGARYSIALGRRSVTHVILGMTSAQGDSGSGLAATKIQKEIARIRGKAVKFVTVEWVLESIKAGRRLPESRFSPLKLAPRTQSSVLGMWRASATE